MSRKKNNSKKNEDNKQQTSEQKNYNGSRGQQSSQSGNASQSASENDEKDDAAEKGNKGRSNDPAWYGQIGQILYDACNLPFAYQMGRNYIMRGHSVYMSEKQAATSSRTTATYTIKDNQLITRQPGVVSMLVKPSLGVNEGLITDPVNVAANTLYTMLRYANSGRKNYDPCDAMLYGLSITELYSFACYCQRLYNIAFTYSQENAYFGDALLEENWVDAKNFRENLANFRYWLNTFISKITAYVVPSDLFLFARRCFMFQAIYTDDVVGNIKDQLYQFVPAGWMRFELDQNSKGSLVFQDYTSDLNNTGNRHTVAQIMAFGENLLNPIWGDEDFSLISGDMLKAYQGKILTMSLVPPEGGILPIHDEAVLMQFKNATIMNLKHMNHDRYTGTGNVYEGNVGINSAGMIVSYDTADDALGSYDPAQPAATVAQVGQMIAPLFTQMDKLLSDPAISPTPEYIMEDTRLMLGFYKSLKSSAAARGNNSFIISSGADICVGCNIRILPSRMADGSSEQLYRTPILSNVYGTGLATFTPEDIFRIISATAAFKYAPMLYFFDSQTVTTPTTGHSMVTLNYAVKLLTPVDNVSIVTSEMLEKMHNVAMLSLLYVPTVAKIATSSK